MSRIISVTFPKTDATVFVCTLLPRFHIGEETSIKVLSTYCSKKPIKVWIEKFAAFSLRTIILSYKRTSSIEIASNVTAKYLGTLTRPGKSEIEAEAIDVA